MQTLILLFGCRRRLFLFCLVFLHVVVNVLNVVVVLKLLKELLDLLALFRSNFLVVVRNTLKLCALDFEAVLFEVFLDVGKRFESTVEND